MSENRLGEAVASSVDQDGRPTAANAGRVIVQGAIGGIIAGVVFALFEMATAFVMMGGMDAAAMPLRMIGGIAIGSQALEPSYPLATAAGAGIGVHMALSAIYGGLFGAGVWAFGRSASTGLIVGAAVVFGLALWAGNFFVVAPIAGWNWFPQMTDPVVQITAHGLFFGVPLGLWVARSMRRGGTRG
jgi:hypothetical protein